MEKEKPSKRQADEMPLPMRKGKTLFVLCMVTIPILSFLVFYVYKNISSFTMAFQQISGFSEGSINYEFTFDNFAMFFREMQRTDSIVGMAFINTLKYFVLGTFILFPIGYFISFFLYKKIWGHTVFRIIFFLTGIIPAVVLITIYREVIAVQGPIYQILENWGIEMPSLLNREETATGTIMAYVVWTGMASNFILLVAAMNRIPEELRDALAIDGCGWARELFQIVTPLIWPTTSTLIILSFIGIFNSSGPILLFNTPEYTWTISHWTYMQVTEGSYSFPSAVGLFLTAVTLPFVIVLMWVMQKLIPEVEY